MLLKAIVEEEQFYFSIFLFVYIGEWLLLLNYFIPDNFYLRNDRWDI